MKTAIVTGASSGIGLAIAAMLLDEGYQVYGFGRDFSREEYTSLPLASSTAFIPVICDLTKINELTAVIEKIRRENSIHLLVNNAGVGYFSPHEELNPLKIHAMVTTNLEVPMVLSQLLLRDLKKNKGTILNISSITAKKSNTYGCAYGATKAGLSSFSRSLFDEVRKYGVKVVTIHPDMTQSDFYRNSNFCEGDTIDSYLLPSEIADACRTILTARDGLVVTDLTLQPQIHRLTKDTKGKRNGSQMK